MAVNPCPPPPQAGAIPATQAEADARRLIEQWGELDEYDQYLAVPTMTALIAELDLMHSRLAAAERDRDDARRDLRDAVDLIVWMSGASDFSPGGKARQGWEKSLERVYQLLAAVKAPAAPGTGGTTGGEGT
jgi:hypothetical protein